MSIRENRIISVNDRIISLSHLQELAQVITEEYNTAKKNSKDARILFSVKCFEPSSFESTDLSIFKDNSIITKKRVKSVTMLFSDNKKGVTIRLNHGWKNIDDERLSDSDIEISGNDSFWVSGLSDKLNTVINAFPSQNSPIVNHGSKIRWVAFILGMISFGMTMDFASNENDDFTPYWTKAFSSTDNFIGNFILAAMVSGFFVSIVNSFIEKAHDLWPTIELQIGPEHSFAEKRRRRLLATLITLLIIPATISIVSGFIN